MPHWTEGPPDDASGVAVRIVRTPAATPIVGVITQDKIRGTATHFAHNRTVPCEKPNACPWCDDGYSWRWHAYLSAVMGATYEHFIFECTAIATETFAVYCRQRGTLRACKFQAHRPSKRPNGRVVIACKYIDETKIRLPDPLDVARILCHIWNVKFDPEAFNGRTRPMCDHIGVLPKKGDGRYAPHGNGED